MAKAFLGKAAMPDDLPFVTGTIGWLGTGASNTMMQECDTLLQEGYRLTPLLTAAFPDHPPSTSVPV